MLTKLLFKIFVMLFVFMGLGSYGMYLTTGRTPFDLSGLMEMAGKVTSLEFKGSTLEAPAVESSDGTTDVLRAGSMRVYKWQDAQGQWHYGEKPPEDLAGVESMVINRDLNVIAGVRPPPEEPEPEAPQQSVPGMPGGNPYTPEGVKKLFEDAKALQKVMEERTKAQQALMD